MKISNILNIVLAVALVVLSVKLVKAKTADVESTEAATELTTDSETGATSGQWTETDPSELDSNPFDLFSNALSLSVGNKDKMNAMTIGWGGLGVLWGRDRAVLTVYVREDRYTHGFMENNEYFVVEGFGNRYRDQLHYLGSASGRNEDKMTGSGLTVSFTEQGTPYFEEGDIMFVCKKIYGAPLNPDGFGELAKDMYKDKPLHSMYIGEIERIMVKR